MAGFLVRTPYVVLLSIVRHRHRDRRAEFAGEMGPITNYANDTAITAEAGSTPRGTRATRSTAATAPLAPPRNRELRGVIMMIADNLLTCNRFFRTLKERWVAAGVDERHVRPAAKRFCRIAYQMVAGGQVFRHPSCQSRDAILRKLSAFHSEHETALAQVMTDLQASVDHIPESEHTAEARSLFEAMQPSYSPTANRAAPAGRDSARSFGQAGGDCCRIEFEGGERPHVTARAREPNNA